jgi:predicted porin
MTRWIRPILAAAGLLLTVAPAVGAEPVTIGLGGRLREFFFVADQKSAPPEKLNAVGQFNEALIAVEAKTTLANGMTIRAFGRYDIANGNSQNLNQAYVDIGTDFGRFRMGTNFSGNTSLIGDPVPQAFFTVDEEIVADALRPRTSVTIRDALTFKKFVENAQGIAYQTPEWEGFRLGVTYHPSTDTAAGLGTGTIDKLTQANNAVDVTVAKEGNFPGGTYRVYAGYFTVNAPTISFLPLIRDTTTAWNIAAGLTYGGWEVAGGYMDTNDANGRDEQAWGIGLLYGIGPWRISTDYRHMQRVAFFGAPRHDVVERVQLQSAYKLAPGFSVGMVGFYAGQRNAAGISYDSKGLVGGIKLDF